jgi:pimeloyl-ACP methyl ester carboxylesterase
VAEQLEALLEALRIARVDLVASGSGALVGRALAARPALRVRRMVAIDGEDTRGRPSGRGARRHDPDRALRARLLEALPTCAGPCAALSRARACQRGTWCWPIARPLRRSSVSARRRVDLDSQQQAGDVRPEAGPSSRWLRSRRAGVGRRRA